jgi:hypothetical protein
VIGFFRLAYIRMHDIFLNTPYNPKQSEVYLANIIKNCDNLSNLNELTVYDGNHGM